MKKAILIGLSILLIFGAIGCQATPKKNIVTGKNLDKMIESATKTSESGQSASGTSLKEKLGAKDSYTKELHDANGKVKINVDAKVIIPDATGVIVQRVEKDKFTQDQVDVLIKQLVRGELYTGDSYEPTKSEIQQQITRLEAAIAKNSGSVAAGKDKDMQEYVLVDLKEQLKIAPDTVTKTTSSGKFEPVKTDYVTGEKVYARAKSEKGGFENLEVYNYDEGGFGSYIDYTSEKSGFSKNMGFFSTKEVNERAEAVGYTPYITTQEIAQIPDISISAEQAKEKAETLIKALGIENMICDSEEKEYGGSDEKISDQSAYINPRKCVWYLHYMRKVNNVPITYTHWDSVMSEEGSRSLSDANSAPWPYEKMTFAVDDSGIVGFNWRSPYKITGTVTENSNLTSFDDITQIFDTISLAVNAWDGIAKDAPDLTGVEINVDQIKFGLTRVTEQDKRNSGLLIPAWDFMGTITEIISQNGNTKRFEYGPIPVLTINAIDGSIINRKLGY